MSKLKWNIKTVKNKIFFGASKLLYFFEWLSKNKTKSGRMHLLVALKYNSHLIKSH